MKYEEMFKMNMNNVISFPVFQFNFENIKYSKRTNVSFYLYTHTEIPPIRMQNKAYLPQLFSSISLLPFFPTPSCVEVNQQYHTL